MDGGYARLSGDWTDPPPPDGAPPAAEWPLEAAGPETMHALSTLQEETVAAAAAGPAEGHPPQSRSSRPVMAASRSLSVQSSTRRSAAGSEPAASDAGSLPASSCAEERVPSGGSSPPSRPGSGLRKPPRKGQGTVSGHRMSPAVLSAIVEWCHSRRGAAGAAGAHHSGSGSFGGDQRMLDGAGGSFGGRRRSPAGPAQPAAPALTGAAARLGSSGHLRRQRAAHLPPIFAEGTEVTAAARHKRHGSGASSAGGSGRAGGGSARGSSRAESQVSASGTGAVASSASPCSAEEHDFPLTATAEGSGEVLGDGGFELLRRVPGIRTGRRVSFDASLGRGSTNDDGGQSGSPAASSESREGASSECSTGGGFVSEASSHADGAAADAMTPTAVDAQPLRPSEQQALTEQPLTVRASQAPFPGSFFVRCCTSWPADAFWISLSYYRSSPNGVLRKGMHH